MIELLDMTTICGKQKVEISFRDAYKFPSTNYGAFGLFRYPARFIPQVVLFILKNYVTSTDIIFDPFAGYGTVGFASRLTGNKYELWDLNPILDLIHKTVTINLNKTTNMDKLIHSILKMLQKRKEIFIPKWSNLEYWIPKEFIEFLGYIWYNAHNMDIPEKPLVLTSLLRVTRYFSYSDEKIYKLYKSKRAKAKINSLLSTDWQKEFFILLNKELKNSLKKLLDYKSLKPKEVDYVVKAGTDVFTESLRSEVDVLITSPPYLQAQEYIRSTKLELFWLGYTEEYIKKLSRREIPYRRDIPEVKIYSETYEKYKSLIYNKKLRRMYEKYFKSIIFALEKFSIYVRKKMFIFVGPVQVEEIKIPIDDIIVEHFSCKGWEHELTLIDKVKARAMFNTKNKMNPASGRKNSRMETEHLVILSRHD